MTKKYRIQIEETCPDCDGDGKVAATATPEGECDCDMCDGTGWVIEYVSLPNLKDLIDETYPKGRG